MGAKRLILGPSFRVLLDRMTEEILRSRSVRPLDPVLVLVPDVPLSRFVESHVSRISDRPVLNVQVMPLWLMPRRVWTRIVAPPAPSHRALLRLACSYVLKEAAERHASAHRLGQLAGIEESLLQTFHELLEAGIQDPSVVTAFLESDSPISEIGKTTLMLYASWLETLRSRDLWPNQRIVSELRLEVPFDQLHVFGFTHISGIWHDFMNSLVEANQGMEISIYYPCRSRAKKSHVSGYEFALREIDERMGALSIEEIASRQRAGPVAAEIDRLHSLIAGENRAEPLSTNAVQVISAPGETGEIEATAREITRLIREAPYDEQPEAIAVLARDLDRYIPVIQRVFRERDIPISWLKPIHPNHNPTVRWIQSILALPSRGFKRDDMIGIFLSPFLRAPRGISRNAFRRFEQQLLELCITSFDDDTWIERTHLVVDCHWRDAVAAFLKEMRDLANAQTGTECRERLIGFVQHWVRADLSEDHGVLGPWLRQLEWLSLIDEYELCPGEGTGKTLLQLVTDDLTRLPLAEPAPRSRGVVVGGVDEAMGMSFDVVFLLGVNRGQFPKRVREDPLLPDVERSRLFNVLGYPLTIRANEHAHEKLLFVLTALAASSRLFILFQHSSYAGKPESESLFIPLFFGERAMERVCVIPSNVEQELQSVAIQAQPPLTTREAMTLLAKEHPETSRNAEQLAVHSGGVFWEFLRRAKIVAEERNGRSISAHDFAVEGTPATMRSSLRVAGAWHDMEICPYRFFLARILRIPKLEQPEALWSLSILDEGSLVHKFFERLFHDGMPEKGNESVAIGSAFREAVAWYHASHPEADLSALFAYQINRTKQWLLPVAEREIALMQREREDSGFPKRILVEYTPPHASLTCTIGDENQVVTIPLSIRVDRVDLDFDENGQVNRSRLIDYKVRSKETSRGRDAGNLQLYLYAEALALHGIGRPDAAYVEFFSGHEPATVTMLSQDGDDEVLNGLYGEKVEHLLEHLHGEHTPFFLTDGRGHECSWCDYRWYCRRYDFVLTQKSDEASTVFFAALKDMNKKLQEIHKETMTERYR